MVWQYGVKLETLHATESGLNKLYLDNYKLKSKLYPNKDIHILSFTFDTIKRLYHSKKFQTIVYVLTYFLVKHIGIHLVFLPVPPLCIV